MRSFYRPIIFFSSFLEIPLTIRRKADVALFISGQRPEHSSGFFVKVRGIVPHKEAIRIMMKSHVLLVKASGEGTYGQIPGEFFEYLDAKNRVLCLGPKKSEVAEIIYKLKLGYVVENDQTEMLEVLETEYGNYLKGYNRCLDSCAADHFNSESMAEKVLDLISS